MLCLIQTTKKYKGDFIRLFMDNLIEEKKKGKNVLQKK